MKHLTYEKKFPEHDDSHYKIANAPNNTFGFTVPMSIKHFPPEMKGRTS